MTKKEKILVPQCLSNLVPLKKGFTLAEVLITLGIIGIVAAMTIPTLVANYQAKSWGTAATVFERKLEEALKVMNTQQSLAGYTTTEDFVTELKKHIKIIKTCNNDKLSDCFSETVYWGGGTADAEEVDMSVIKTAKNFGQKDWGTNIVGVQFANGTNALIAYNPITHSDDSTVKVCKQDPFSNKVTGGDCLAILYDTSGFKSPNTSGKDLRANEHVKSLGSGCAFEINGTCYATAPFVPTPVTKAECEQLKADGYGINACYFDNDYWAGAVKACGGTSKMPTMAQIAEIANYVYNTDIIGAKTDNGAIFDGNTLTLDTAKATSLGFTLDSSNAFAVWSSEEVAASNAYNRYFSPPGSGWGNNYRNFSTPQAVCLGD